MHVRLTRLPHGPRQRRQTIGRLAADDPRMFIRCCAVAGSRTIDEHAPHGSADSFVKRNLRLRSPRRQFGPNAGGDQRQRIARRSIDDLDGHLPRRCLAQRAEERRQCARFRRVTRRLQTVLPPAGGDGCNHDGPIPPSRMRCLQPMFARGMRLQDSRVAALSPGFFVPDLLRFAVASGGDQQMRARPALGRRWQRSTLEFGQVRPSARGDAPSVEQRLHGPRQRIIAQDPAGADRGAAGRLCGQWRVDDSEARSASAHAAGIQYGQTGRQHSEFLEKGEPGAENIDRKPGQNQ